MTDYVEKYLATLNLRAKEREELTFVLEGYQLELDKANERIAELEEIVEAVAHIGVDFGYGKFELEQSHIDLARKLMEQEL